MLFYNLVAYVVGNNISYYIIIYNMLILEIVSLIIEDKQPFKNSDYFDLFVSYSDASTSLVLNFILIQ
jgi:hypothetical protein